MSNTDVSSCVSAIIASFANGLDVLRRVRESRSSSRRRLKTVRPKASKDVKTGLAKEEEELQMRLSRSLRFGHESITREYQGAYGVVGDGFAVGDATAQTKLAEVLLRLNTGLVGIITSFLSSDKKKHQQKNIQPDYQRLTDISEQSRIDTCQILSQLYQRITAPFRPKATRKTSRTVAQVKTDEDGKRASTTHQASANRAKKLMQKSSQPLHEIAFVRPGRKKQRPSRPTASVSTPNLSTLSSSKTATTLPKATSAAKIGGTDISSNRTAKQGPSRTKASSQVNEPRKTQSASNITSSRKRQQEQQMHISSKQQPRKPTRSTPALVQSEYTRLNFLPPLIEQPLQTNLPLPSESIGVPAVAPQFSHHQQKPTDMRQRPQSFHSIAFSARTRLGEIPMSLWEEPWDFETMERLNREAMEAGWPIALPGGESLIERHGVQGRKKRIGGGILKMFRRRE